MSRIIISNESHLTDAEALRRAATVIDGGRISGQCYCYATSWADGIAVYASPNKCSDKLHVRSYDPARSSSAEGDER